MKKPNALIHMTLWGLLTGIISGFAYPLLMTSFGIDFAWEGILVMATLYGALPGLGMGLITGGMIHYYLRDIDEDTFEAQAEKSRKWVAAFAFFGTTIFMMLAFSPNIFKDVMPSTIIPIVTAIVAAIMTEAYLGRINRKREKLKQ
jgi:uncharacterized membrane protein